MGLARWMLAIGLLSASTARLGFAQAEALPASLARGTVLRFDGDVRLRLEGWNGFNFGAPPSADDGDQFLLFRARGRGRLDLGPRVTFVAQVKSALVTGRDLAGGNSAAFYDELDLQQGYAEVRTARGSRGAAVRVGRQELALGRERLVSPLEWGNVRRTLEGIAVATAGPRGVVHGFWSRPVPVRKYDFNERSGATAFYGLHVSPATRRFSGLDLYWYGLNNDAATYNGTTGAERRHTFGARVAGPPTAPRVDYEVEAAYQTGTVGSEDIAAAMLTVQVGWRLSRIAGAPRLYAQLDYASGDDAAGGSVGTFNHLFPLGHAYLGFADVLGRQNVVDLSVGGAARVGRANVAVDLHRFLRASTADAMYGSGGAVTRPGAGGTSRSVGTEVDLTYRRVLGRGVNLAAGYSRVFAGAFIAESGPDRNIDFAYVMLAAAR